VMVSRVEKFWKVGLICGIAEGGNMILWMDEEFKSPIALHIDGEIWRRRHIFARRLPDRTTTNDKAVASTISSSSVTMRMNDYITIML